MSNDDVGGDDLGEDRVGPTNCLYFCRTISFICRGESDREVRRTTETNWRTLTILWGGKKKRVREVTPGLSKKV